VRVASKVVQGVRDPPGDQGLPEEPCGWRAKGSVEPPPNSRAPGEQGRSGGPGPPRATRTFLKSRARGASGTPQAIQTLVLYETLNYLVAGTEAP